MADTGDNEDFLYLDGGDESEKAQPTKRKKAVKKDADSTPGVLAETTSDEDITVAVDDNIAEITADKLTPFDDGLASLSLGVQKARWPLSGMDCPDCAMKATRAISRLDSVSECTVSATQGCVEVEIDLELGNLAQLNSILSSLGHAPEVEWLEIAGVKASRLGERLSMDGRSLARMLKNQPGLLDVELSNDDRVLVQVPSDSSPEMVEGRDDALRNLTGKDVRLRHAGTARLRPDQLRLLGGAIAIPLLILVLIGEVIGTAPWVLLVIGLPAVIIGGWRMFAEAIASIRNRQLGFQVLTSLAVIGAVSLGAWSEALMVVVLVAFASHLEGKALVRARNAMQGGLDRLPRIARLADVPEIKLADRVADATIELTSVTGVERVSNSPLASSAKGLVASAKSAAAKGLVASAISTGPGGDGAGKTHRTVDHGDSREIPLAALQVGDVVEVRSGEIIPVDGEIIDGVGSIDRAPLTGESLAVRVSGGDAVEAGLVLRRGPITIRASAVGEDTRLSGLIDKVHTFRDIPPRFQSSIEMFTVFWIPLVLIGAPLAWFLSGDAENWKIMLLLWVVACPCALLLAAPLPHAAALANASHYGVIARGGDVLERTSRVNLALLDKTGTLTTGHPSLSEVVLAKGKRRNSVIRLAAGIEASSNHPYANVIRELCQSEDLSPHEVLSLNDGKAGVSGVSGGKKVMFGRSDWVIEEGVVVPSELAEALVEAGVAGHGSSLLSKDGLAIAMFSFVHDDIRAGAGQLVREMYGLGINIEILSGDNAAAVSSFGPLIGVPATACRGDMSPEDKTRWVEARARTHVVMMAGDGFNDATAMAKADVGVAIGSGEQVNLDAADILIPSEDPRLITRFIGLSRQTKRAVRQNLLLSVLITIALVWSVLQGINDKLWIGVLVHEASAVLVILNGARIAGNDGMFTLLRNILVDLVVDFKQAVLAWKGQRISPSPLTRA